MNNYQQTKILKTQRVLFQRPQLFHLLGLTTSLENNNTTGKKIDHTKIQIMFLHRTMKMKLQDKEKMSEL